MTAVRYLLLLQALLAFFVTGGLFYQNIKQKTEKAFTVDQVYLKNKLTIDLLSNLLAERSYHISQTFSSFLHENFNDYVNRHRIAHTKKMLLNLKYSNYKIEAIAL